MARMITNWQPIRRVLQGAVAPVVQIPKTFTVIPPSSIYPENPPMGFFGTTTPEPYHSGNNSILISPTYMNWWYGRYGTEIWATYLNGWPHTALTADSAEGARTLAVDDVTGMGGAAPWINDGGVTEQVVVTAVTPNAPVAYDATVTYPAGILVTSGGSTFQAMIPNGPGTPFGPQTPVAGPYWSTTLEPAGPGTLTIASATLFAHTSGATVTAVPDGALWACALFAKAVALQRGLATVSIPSDGGDKAVSTEMAIQEAMREGVAHLVDFRRIV